MISCLAVVLALNPATVAASDDPLLDGFRHPPEQARPRVWWHWMNGNVTPDGITADLEWMHRIGLGGFHLFDVDIGTAQYVRKRRAWMTPAWRAALRHAAEEAARLDLEMGIASSPGWSEAGGPWVPPEQAMKKIVWSSATLSGPGPIDLKLESPPDVDGPFQDMAYAGPVTLPTDAGTPPPSADRPVPLSHGYYRDLKVVAIPAPAEPRFAEMKPVIRSSSGPIDTRILLDGSYAQAIPIDFRPDDAHQQIDIALDRPIAATSMTVAFLSNGQMMRFTVPAGRFEGSADGEHWRVLAPLPGPGHPVSNLGVRTFAFPRFTGRNFRLVLDRPAIEPVRALAGLPALTVYRLAELDIGTGAAIDRWQGKAQYAGLLEYPSTKSSAGEEAVPLARAIDISANMRADGSLHWNAPPGKWEILRFGESLIGVKNHPASPEATGYEVDKLDRAGVGDYFDTYLARIKAAAGPQFGKSLRVLMMDGIESGVQNGTTDIMARFRKDCGYDPVPFLPVLAGRVIDSPERSERFLWDYRRVLANLLRDDYYDVAAGHARANGLKLYAQATGPNAPADANALETKGRVDVPMAEFWTMPSGMAIADTFAADLQEAASAAHIYGKPIAAAESFTTYHGAIPAWGQGPFYLKQFADQAFALGINQFVLHTSVHQPFTDGSHRPGLMLGPFGQNFGRNMTWAEQAKDWVGYLARTSYLLQQGHSVADIAYFQGEGTPSFVPFWKSVKPALPEGMLHDWLDPEVLRTARVDKGDIVLESGARYRVLVLPDSATHLTLPMVEKLAALVEAGATLVAPPPGTSPSLVGYPDSDAQIASISNRVWGGIDGAALQYSAYGKGRIFWGPPLDALLPAIGIQPDLQYSRPRLETKLVWTHRRTKDSDIYFVASRNAFPQDVTLDFRIDDKAPERWDSADGTVADMPYEGANGRTRVPMHLDPYGSAFVIFRRPVPQGSSSAAAAPTPAPAVAVAIDGRWQLRFPTESGAPATVTMDRLASLTDSPVPDIRYFAGTVIYSKTIDVPAAWLGGRILVDLGTVAEIAEVSVNGTPIARSLWKPPFQADITALLKPGANRLEVRVTNLWTNRMIGDLQPGVTRKHGFTNFQKLFTKDSPLLPSGLIGPVRLLREAADGTVARR
jgi:hypothetical protein